jgi:hypothetical protein
MHTALTPGVVWVDNAQGGLEAPVRDSCLCAQFLEIEYRDTGRLAAGASLFVVMSRNSTGCRSSRLYACI